MKVIIERKVLAEVVGKVEKAVNKKNDIPVLTGILVKVEQGTITFCANNNEVSILEVISGEGVTIERDGAVVIPGKIFSETVKKIRGKEVEISVDDTHKSVVKAGKTQIEIPSFDAEEFPKPATTNAEGFTVNSDVLKTAFEKTVFAAAVEESRPILQGVQLVGEGEQVVLQATDSHRLAKKTMNVAVGEIQAVIPRVSISMLNSILPKNVEVKVVIAQSQLVATFGDIIFSSRLLNGAYPDTSKIIPKTFKTMIVAKKEELIAALEVASIVFENKGKGVVSLKVSGEGLEIEGKGNGNGNVEEFVSISNFTGDETKISFNPRFVMDALRVISETEVGIAFNGRMAPFVITTMSEDKSEIHLVLPVRTV